MSARYDRASSIPILPINGDKMSSFANIWRKPIFYSAGQEVLQRDGEIKFTMTCGGVSRCTVRVSSALLSDQHLTSIELRWALKKKDIARKLLSGDYIDLNHEMLRTGNMGAIARRRRQIRSSGNE